MDVKVKIANLPQIRAAFLKAPAKMTRNLNEAIRKSIFMIEREGKIRTPVDTGRLRASYITRFSSLRGEVGPTANYSLFVHEGTRYMRGRPFLRNAIQSAEQQIQGNFRRAVQDTLDDIGRQV